MNTSNRIEQSILEELVDRIVGEVHPLRIIIFGSAARGQIGPHSDIDILVVMPDGNHRRRTAFRLYRRLFGLGLAKDIVVVTESDVARHGDNPALVIHPALQEGREVYSAA